MQIVARVLRGPSWLVWLGLMLAAHVAAAHPAVAAVRDDGSHGRAAIHRCPTPDDGVAACDLDSGDRDDQPHTPAVPAVFTPTLPSCRGLAPREIVRRSDSPDVFFQLGPRPPPSTRSS